MAYVPVLSNVNYEDTRHDSKSPLGVGLPGLASVTTASQLANANQAQGATNGEFQ